MEPNAKLAIMVERLGPYHRARLEALGRAIGFDNLVVIEVAPASQRYGWGECHSNALSVVPVIQGRDYKDIWSLDCWRRTWSTLRAVRPGLVALNGWGVTEAWAARQWCRSNSVPTIVVSDSQERDAPRSLAKETVKRWFLKGCDAALVAGAPQRRYLQQLGVPLHKIADGVDVVDNAHFRQGAERARANAPELRGTLGLPQRYFLTCARLVAKKGIGLLVQAFDHYRKSEVQETWSLVIIGDGPLRHDIESQVARLQLQQHVKLVGFRQYNQLPDYYGLASAFVLPSLVDPWGLVVNEAMASGLPVVVSRACGCNEDLVQNNVNGITVEPGNVDALAEGLGMLSARTAYLEEMGAHSSKIIEKWDLNRFVSGVIDSTRIAKESFQTGRSRKTAASVAPRRRSSQPRTLLLTNMVPPYRVPVFQELDDLLGGKCKVVALTRMEGNRQWKDAVPEGLGVKTLAGYQLRAKGWERIIHVNWGLRELVKQERPEVVVIGGWDAIASWCLLRAARAGGSRIVLWSGSHRFTSRVSSEWRTFLKRIFVGKCDAFVAYGSLAREYLVALGANQERVVTGTNAVECSRFAPDPERRTTVRAIHGVGDSVVVLFSGQIIPRKGLDDLIEAMACVPPQAILWVVGAGKERARYEALAQVRIPGRYIFFGHQEYGDMPGFFNAADLLVMPSYEEVWGLVVNEAMSAGLPVVASSRAGATADLIVDGESGYSVEPGDVSGLAERIRDLVTDSEARTRMGQKGRDRVLEHNTDRYAADIYRAIVLAMPEETQSQ